MFIALAIGAVLLAAICVSSSSMKLRQHERAVAIIGGTVGVPLRLFPVLASLELAGTAGILIGLWPSPATCASATRRTSRCRCRRSCCPSPCLSSG